MMHRGLARIDTVEISYPGCWTMLPARTPYELGIAAEHILSIIHQHDDVDVKLGGMHWAAKTEIRVAARVCTACAQPLRGASFSRFDEILCWGCVRHERTAQLRQPRIAGRTALR